MPHLFKNNARNGIWYVSFTTKYGKRKQFTCKTKSQREANKYYQKRLQEIYDEEDRPKLKAVSLAQFAEEYLASKRGERISKAQIKEIKASVTFLQRALGDVALHTITVSDCERFVTRGWTFDGWPSRWTARKHFTNLKAAFSAAKRWGHVRENPFDQIEKPKPEEVIPEIFTRRELTILVDSLPEDSESQRRTKNVVILAANTGLRLGECLHLERRDVSFEKHEIYVRAKKDWSPKSRKPRVVPLSEDAVKALRAQIRDNALSRNERVQSSSSVFPGPHGLPVTIALIERPFMRVCAEQFSGRGLHFHSLRHTFASFLVEEGVPLTEIQRILGHSTIQMTEKYARLRGNNFSKALTALNRAPSMVRTSYITPEAFENHAEALTAIEQSDTNKGYLGGHLVSPDDA